jgi:hypothetical protein
MSESPPLPYNEGSSSPKFSRLSKHRHSISFTKGGELSKALGDWKSSPLFEEASIGLGSSPSKGPKVKSFFELLRISTFGLIYFSKDESSANASPPSYFSSDKKKIFKKIFSFNKRSSSSTEESNADTSSIPSISASLQSILTTSPNEKNTTHTTEDLWSSKIAEHPRWGSDDVKSAAEEDERLKYLLDMKCLSEGYHIELGQFAIPTPNSSFDVTHSPSSFLSVEDLATPRSKSKLIEESDKDINHYKDNFYGKGKIMNYF